MSEHLAKENKITVLAFFVGHQWIAHVIRVMLLGKGFHLGLELFVTSTKRSTMWVQITSIYIFANIFGAECTI